MISIIICSCNKSKFKNTRDNIKRTIGVPYEIIAIDNTNNEYNIFTAYNQGISQAKGDVCCFMHEDVIFHTDNWGKQVYHHFLDDTVGVIGVFGGHYMPKMYPVSYVDGPCSGVILQGHNKGNHYYTTNVTCTKFRHEGKLLVECAVVDGMWMCVKRKLFDDIKFDDDCFNGFHCYDIDICLQTREIGKKVGVVFDILVEHQSPGNINDAYFEQLKKWYEKWNDRLPVRVGIEKSDIPKFLLSMESFCIHKAIKKEEWERQYETIRGSRIYKLIIKLSHFL